jgi:hypothetical protein
MGVSKKPKPTSKPPRRHNPNPQVLSRSGKLGKAGTIFVFHDKK